MSYDGAINFGLVGDYEAMAGLDSFAADLEASLNELAATVPGAGKRRASSRRGPRRSASAAG